MDNEILDTYEHICALTGEMLAAARGADWDRLVELEHDCGKLFAQLATLEDGAARDAQFQKRKAALIREVLDNDAEIRARVEPWLAELQQMLGAHRSERRLRDAYGP